MPLSDIDRKLIDRCLGKEPGAWKDFVDRYLGLIYHVIQHVAHARSRVVSQADMEDIASEVLLKIVDDDYDILRRYQGISSLPTYLTVIVRRICIKDMVKRRREEELGHANAHRATVGDSGEVEAIATAEEVERMLQDLPDREAEVVRLYHLKYMNYREIGKRLGVPEASVGPILSKARKRLRINAEHRDRPESAPAAPGEPRAKADHTAPPVSPQASHIEHRATT
ncbi:RNA polymerase sigma factor [Aquisphaera giovannonii]|uniref:RNA polymerase sigma factor n=1 Tax=Aquisphaera giovannonii TaxID=406548 RepID=A0A5B9W9M5_9BACT|nr:sigma-70 family RNA polymerase sigma factor [Aquisphaera giovannonii]QEH36964.1 RNA polymerase sigma factor [Aquisphaera giovannonii]